MSRVKTLKDLKSHSKEDLKVLWDRYFKEEVNHSPRMLIRPLWYKIQCQNNKTKLPQKILTRLNRYSKAPDKYIHRATKTKYVLSEGTEIIKNYKGREYKVRVINDSDFLFEDKHYKTLSAVAREICGSRVSGPDFFGLDNKKVNYVKS